MYAMMSARTFGRMGSDQNLEWFGVKAIHSRLRAIRRV